MAKNLVLNKEFNKRRIYTSHFLNRQVHNSFLKDSRLSLAERQLIYQKVTKVRYSSSLVRLKNYCMLTAHSRSIYRDVKLSRHKFNTMVLNGLIPGCLFLHGNLNLNSVSHFIAIIKICLARRKLTAKVPYSNLNYNILKILKHEGYIRGFRVSLSTRNIYVFLKYNNFRSGFLDMACFCPKNSHSYISYLNLVRFYGLKNFGIVSTNLGLMTLEQCFLYKKGGTLLILLLS